MIEFSAFPLHFVLKMVLLLKHALHIFGIVASSTTLLEAFDFFTELANELVSVGFVNLGVILDVFNLVRITER